MFGLSVMVPFSARLALVVALAAIWVPIDAIPMQVDVHPSRPSRPAALLRRARMLRSVSRVLQEHHDPKMHSLTPRAGYRAAAPGGPIWGSSHTSWPSSWVHATRAGPHRELGEAPGLPPSGSPSRGPVGWGASAAAWPAGPDRDPPRGPHGPRSQEGVLRVACCMHLPSRKSRDT